MQLTPLELSLLGGMVTLISSGVTGILVRNSLSKRYMTKEMCERNHQGERNERDILQQQHTRDMRDIKKSNSILFKMVRALITHSDIPDHEKAQILNTNGGGNG